MGREYRLGIRVVLLAILLAAGLSFTVLWNAGAAVRTGQRLGETAFPLGKFSLTERSGRAITDADLGDRVAIVSFIFTRCPLSCPRITSMMKSLQEKLEGRHVQLISITVDPDFDTPEVLGKYAERVGADPSRWWFLTGSRDAIYELIEKRFKLSVAIPSPEESKAGAEAVLHSDRLALVDRGHLVGLFDSNDATAIKELVSEASRRSRPAWVAILPSVNATLNGICAILLLLGWNAIQRPRESSEPTDFLSQRRVQQHRLAMVAAVLTSALFLGCYLFYHYFAGSVEFRGRGALRSLYLTILISHTLLATFGVVPLVTLTLFRAFAGDFARHARIARVTYPIWLYVSITGVVIYLMLYQMPIPEPTVVVGV